MQQSATRTVFVLPGEHEAGLRQKQTKGVLSLSGKREKDEERAAAYERKKEPASGKESNARQTNGGETVTMEREGETPRASVDSKRKNSEWEATGCWDTDYPFSLWGCYPRGNSTPR